MNELRKKKQFVPIPEAIGTQETAQQVADTPEAIIEQKQAKLIREVATGSAEAEAKLSQYIEKCWLTVKSQVELVDHLAIPICKEAVKRILVKYQNKWGLCEDARTELIWILANPDCTEEAEEVLLGYAKKWSFVEDDEKQLVNCFTKQQQCSNAAGNVVILYIQKNNHDLCNGTVICMVELLLQPECRDIVAKVLSKYVEIYPLPIEAKNRLEELKENQDCGDVAKQILDMQEAKWD